LSILPVNSCSIDQESGEICTDQTNLQQIYSKPDSLLAAGKAAPDGQVPIRCLLTCRGSFPVCKSGPGELRFFVLPVPGPAGGKYYQSRQGKGSQQQPDRGQGVVEQRRIDEQRQPETKHHQP